MDGRRNVAFRHGGRRALSLIGLVAFAVIVMVVPGDMTRAGLAWAGLSQADDGPCAGLFEIGDSGRCSHGPDPAPPGLSIERSVPPIPARPPGGMRRAPETDARVGAPQAVTCIGDGGSGNRVQVLYVRASDRTDRYGQYLASFKQWVADMDTIYYQSAIRSGGAALRLRFVHDGNCDPVIPSVTISPTGDDNFGNTITELEALGYDRFDRKYLLLTDANVFCGIGDLWIDDRFGQDNYNNTGPSYARVDAGCWAASVMAHEVMHNLGAVQVSAPNTSGYYHCVDEYDVMCYQDSATATMVYLCTPASVNENRLDCHHDDYYSTNPTPGSYLTTHWNTANNTWLLAMTLTPTSTATGTLTPSPTVTPTPTRTATPTPAPGDCNADQAINAADVSAEVLEVFDGDGNLPAGASGGTFPGHPSGCNPNADGAIDAGDVACSVRLLFGALGGCGG